MVFSIPVKMIISNIIDNGDILQVLASQELFLYIVGIEVIISHLP